MKGDKLMTLSIAIKEKNYSQAFDLIKILMDNGYVCCVSYEENLIIIDYVYGLDCKSDRNGIVFMSREEYESILFGEDKND